MRIVRLEIFKWWSRWCQSKDMFLSAWLKEQQVRRREDGGAIYWGYLIHWTGLCFIHRSPGVATKHQHSCRNNRNNVSCFREWSPGGPTQQQLSVVTTVWGVTTSTQSGPHNNFPVSGGTVAAGGVGPGGGGYAQQGAPNKQGTPFTGTGYRQGVPPGWVRQTYTVFNINICN